MCLSCDAEMLLQKAVHHAMDIKHRFVYITESKILNCFNPSQDIVNKKILNPNSFLQILYLLKLQKTLEDKRFLPYSWIYFGAFAESLKVS
jgi:hypothetical protein